MKNNLANIVTMLRILMVPLLVSFFLMDKLYVTAALFSLAAITDGLDGYLARYLQQTSLLGTFLDPVADKLIVINTMLLLISDIKFQGLIIPALIIISREIVISALREWIAMVGKQAMLSVSTIGKWKTAAQMLAVFLCLLSKSSLENSSLVLVAYTSFYVATVLTIVSLIDYLWKAWPAITVRNASVVKSTRLI